MSLFALPDFITSRTSPCTLVEEALTSRGLTILSTRLNYTPGLTRTLRSFMFDRRKDHNDVEEHHPGPEQEEYLAWAEELAQNTECKVEVIYGIASKERALARTDPRGNYLPPWNPECLDVSLYLLYLTDA